MANGLQELLSRRKWVWFRRLRVEEGPGWEEVLHSNVVPKAHAEKVPFVKPRRRLSNDHIQAGAWNCAARNSCRQPMCRCYGSAAKDDFQWAGRRLPVGCCCRSISEWHWRQDIVTKLHEMILVYMSHECQHVVSSEVVIAQQSN